MCAVLRQRGCRRLCLPQGFVRLGFTKGEEKRMEFFVNLGVSFTVE